LNSSSIGLDHPKTVPPPKAIDVARFEMKVNLNFQIIAKLKYYQTRLLYIEAFFLDPRED
jgi:hypothetical protein